MFRRQHSFSASFHYRMQLCAFQLVAARRTISPLGLTNPSSISPFLDSSLQRIMAPPADGLEPKIIFAAVMERVKLITSPPSAPS